MNFSGLGVFICALSIILFSSRLYATGPLDCIDSVGVSIQQVQCHGLRNGVIRIDSVYGGKAPFYFSLDGNAFSTRPFFDHLWAGEYTLWIRDQNGCERQRTLTVPEPEPLVAQLVATDTIAIRGAQIGLQLYISPDNADIQAISWRPPGLFPEQNLNAQSFILSEPLTIAVEVVTHDGCTARAHQYINMLRSNIYVPNVMRPGSNQDAYFTIFSDEGLDKVVNLQIFSRNGDLVFDAQNIPPNDPLKGWNGKMRGKYVPFGVYTWTAVLEYKDGHRERRNGDVTVVP